MAFAQRHQDNWRFQVGAPRSGPVICHNDFGPYNCVYRHGRPVAIIDWDLAAPGPPEWDVAYALWRFVPLYDNAQCSALGWSTAPRGPRVRAFLDAYGDLEVDAGTMLETIRLRQCSTLATIRQWADNGDPDYQRLVSEGRLDEIAANIKYLDTHGARVEDALT
jgi:aminoglycoside phosphotransferase (APT) family kinase protein